MLVTHLNYFEAEFLVFKFDNLVGDELLFDCQLLLALRVETHESCGEEDSVFEIFLDLESD
jgi:hypothetical protein